VAISNHNNLILAALPKRENERLASRLEPILLPQGHTLLSAGRKMEYAYFLEAGLASIVTTMKSGKSVEAGIVGIEGMVGLPVLLGTDRMPNRTFMQIPGRALRVRADFLRREIERGGVLRQKLQHYLQAHLAQVSQTAACNRLHEIPQRLARWVLMCQDRTNSDQLQITHQSLGDMLGAPRPTVTMAAGILHRMGALQYSRGKVRILNRKCLEDTACECYRIIKVECERLDVLPAGADGANSSKTRH
jgi:CRP-like cAMP-binding protein